MTWYWIYKWLLYNYFMHYYEYYNISCPAALVSTLTRFITLWLCSSNKLCLVTRASHILIFSTKTILFRENTELWHDFTLCTKISSNTRLRKVTFMQHKLCHTWTLSFTFTDTRTDQLIESGQRHAAVVGMVTIYIRAPSGLTSIRLHPCHHGN